MIETCICQVCGKEFTPKPNIKNPKFCHDLNCKQEGWRRLAKINSKKYNQTRRNKEKHYKTDRNVPKRMGIYPVEAKCPKCQKIYTTYLDVRYIGNGMLRKICLPCLKSID